MFDIRRTSLPAKALLRRYEGVDGAYTDCYVVDTPGKKDLADVVAAFYVTPLFKLERFLLGRFAAAPSTDEEARELSLGATDRFAYWRVEARESDQLLKCDLAERTRSWFMVEPTGTEKALKTRLYFGSAVVPKKGTNKKGLAFNALLGFHMLYSRALLASAWAQLKRSRSVR